MTVYTFWEPREKIPYYIQLCMQTWRKFLPNTEIVVLDYKNIREYVDVDEIGSNLFSGRFKLAQISDAIRVALLAKHGGIWLDADTIILSSDAEKYFLPDEQNRTVFFGYPYSRKVHMAFINTPPAAKCINVWFEFIKERLRNLKPSTEIDPYFLGNSFINPFAKFYSDEIKVLDAKLVMPELKIIPQDEPLTLANRERHYPIYYFEQNRHLRDVAGYDMLMLHNSWAGMFGNLSSEEVLRCDCTMTNILAEALDIKLPPPSERVRIKIENQKWTFIPAEPPKKRFRLVSLEDRIQPKIAVPTLRAPIKTPSKADKIFIYTFWEPREKIPYYIQMCMKTWKKFLPDAEIVVLDYKNVGNYVDVRELPNLFSGRFKLAHISDAIRVALLAKHGGIWLDADTIILNSDAKKYFLPDEQNRTVFFGYPDSRKVHMAFINTPPNSICMTEWLKFTKECLNNLQPTTGIDPYFLGNSFINPFAKSHVDDIKILDSKIVMPELRIIPPGEPFTLENRRRHYPVFYFEQNRHLADITDFDIIMLHNSWAGMYRNFSAEQFLHCDCTMTNILAEALDIKLPSAEERFRIRIERGDYGFRLKIAN